MAQITFVTLFEGAWLVLRNSQDTGWMLWKHGTEWLVTGPNGHRRYFDEKFPATEYARARVAHPAGSRA